MTEATPSVEVLPAQGETRAVVLVLHGGKSVSTEPSLSRHLSVVRMIPFARAIHRASAADGVATWRVRYRYRGWNGSDASPVADARWALAEVRRRHGDVPVVLLGHSMGGRTALRVADDPAVHTVVTLGPWLPAGEPVAGARGRRVVIAHADGDRWTSPVTSQQWAERARPIAEQVVYVRLRRAGHFMLRRCRLWTSVASSFVLDGLATALRPDVTIAKRSGNGPASNLVAQAAAGKILLTR